MSKKVPVSAPQSPLQSPFSALDAAGLPEGPKTVEPTPPEPKKPKRHRVVLRREKARRGGKTVVVISQLQTHLSPPELENFCRTARKNLGCGGSLQGREIELQGDQPDRVRAYLENLGYQVVGP